MGSRFFLPKREKSYNESYINGERPKSEKNYRGTMKALPEPVEGSRERIVVWICPTKL